MIAIEKWITFVMLAFILVIASCNIISTLSMLILEKEDNMAILTAMGGTRRFINGIFTTQGWLMSVDTYPVILSPADLLATAATLLAVALLITPVIPLIRRPH